MQVRRQWHCPWCEPLRLFHCWDTHQAGLERHQPSLNTIHSNSRYKTCSYHIGNKCTDSMQNMLKKGCEKISKDGVHIYSKSHLFLIQVCYAQSKEQIFCPPWRLILIFLQTLNKFFTARSTVFMVNIDNAQGWKETFNIDWLSFLAACKWSKEIFWDPSYLSCTSNHLFYTCYLLSQW